MNIKHLFNGVAIAAAIAGPVWAQSPSGGNGMGMPGPNPGGGGLLTPYSGGGYPAAATATPVLAYHAIRHTRATRAHHNTTARKAALTGDTTAQLNREELARIQSARIQSAVPPAPPPSVLMEIAPMSAAPMPPQPNPSGGNSIGTPGPNPGGPGLTPYTD